MAEESIFRGVIEFFADVGLYDVVLPFLLVFTIVFAILEKTKIFGVEEISGKKYTKKNLNAMMAFVMAFFVVASSRLVQVITDVSANTVVLLLLSVLFLLLVGSFYKEGTGVFLEGGWKVFFMFIMFIGIVIIFLNAIKVSSGDSWLEVFWDYVSGGRTSNAIGSIILIIVIVLFMVYIVKEPKKEVTEPKTEK
jgi:hypothetical membrane protein